MNSASTYSPPNVPRPRRASRPKVKTGCNNCKTRRVKCGEERPHCARCVRSGRQCEGYPAYNPRIRDGGMRIAIAPRPANGPTAPSSITPSGRALASWTPLLEPAVHFSSPLVICRPPTNDLQLNDEEGRYFQVFRTHTACELSGFFDSEFWTRNVLVESHSQKSIRHAVIALGALYKTLDKSVESPPGSPDGNYGADTHQHHYRFALEQYDHGIKSLRSSFQTEANHSARTQLMTCVLLTCFESFTGDHKGAITHIRGGLALLHQGQSKQRNALMPRKEDSIENDLVQMFTRLAIQAKSYDMAFHFPQPWAISLNPSPTEDADDTTASSPTESINAMDNAIPKVFTDLLDARTVLDSLCERMLRFTETLASGQGLGTTGQGTKILPSWLRSHGEGFRRQLAAWNAAFDPLLNNRHYPKVSSTERAGINVLKMTQQMMAMLFVTAFSKSESDFDNFNEIFQQIVSLAEEVVGAEELSLAKARCGEACKHAKSPKTSQYFGVPPDSYTHIKPSFALDLGIIPPLFVVATKCRERKTRRDAIRLLTATHRREGMWDSILCGKVGEWLMEIEEEGTATGDARGIVGDEKRIMIKEISFNLQTRTAKLSCGTRGVLEGEWDGRARVQLIHW